MTEITTISSSVDNPPQKSRSSVLHVCTSCRGPGSPRAPEENRAGFKLYQELRTIFLDSHLKHSVEVKPTVCLNVCSRHCGIAFSSTGAWSYLFGDQCSGETISDIVEGMSVYTSTDDGVMRREQRPRSLRTSILGRVPPQVKTV